MRNQRAALRRASRRLRRVFAGGFAGLRGAFAAHRRLGWHRPGHGRIHHRVELALAPELLEVVVLAHRGLHDVRDDVAGVHEDPVAGLLALDADDGRALLAQLVAHVAGERLGLARRLGAWRRRSSRTSTVTLRTSMARMSRALMSSSAAMTSFFLAGVVSVRAIQAGLVELVGADVLDHGVGREVTDRGAPRAPASRMAVEEMASGVIEKVMTLPAGAASELARVERDARPDLLREGARAPSSTTRRRRRGSPRRSARGRRAPVQRCQRVDLRERVGAGEEDERHVGAALARGSRRACRRCRWGPSRLSSRSSTSKRASRCVASFTIVRRCSLVACASRPRW